MVASIAGTVAGISVIWGGHPHPVWGFKILKVGGDGVPARRPAREQPSIVFTRVPQTGSAFGQANYPSDWPVARVILLAKTRGLQNRREEKL